MRHPGTRTAGVLLLVLLLVPAAQSAAAVEAARDLDSYVALLQRCADGDIDGAAQALLALDVATSRSLARVAFEQVDSGAGQAGPAGRAVVATRGLFDQRRRQRLTRLTLMLALHTEAALRAGEGGDQLDIARWVAGHLRRLESEFRRHGPIGRGDGAPPALSDWEDVRAHVRDWYLLVVSHLQLVGPATLLRSHVNEGLGAFADDPELLLARGSMSETAAGDAVVDESVARAIYTSQFLQRRRERLSTAGADYNKAARLQPDLMEAHLRWGRVSAQLGRVGDAHRAFEQVESSGASPYLKYLAQLFLGAVAEQHGDAGGAQAAYERALAHQPSAQAPKLSLSRLCAAAGDVAGARRWVARTVEEVRREREDPWWHYRFGQARLGNARLAAFRRVLTP